MAKLKRAVLKEENETPTISKRRRKISCSEDETSFDSRGKCPDSPPLSKIYNSACRNNKPAELFRKDLISAMKLPDSEQLNPEDYWCVTDSWKQEWERGVQVPVNSKNVPIPHITDIGKQYDLGHFKLPKKFIRLSEDDFFSSDIHSLSSIVKDAEKVCHYDMDDLDCCWLDVYNEERQQLGLSLIDEKTIELAMENFETQCFNKFQDAFKTEEGLGIEYDEDVTCDVCRTPECEEGNEMVFCDVCNICVHQACYGITTIPDGSWVCRTCAANIQPSCALCPNKGGAMKSTKSGDNWAHVSCALWVPEVGIIDPEKMEPIAKIQQIPPSRWSLICSLCRERAGACIQCCVKQCKVAYHVTCAFEHGLEMKGIFDEAKEDEGVRLKSYCLKHSNNNKEVVSEGILYKAKNVIKRANKQNGKVSDLDKQNAKLKKIRTMETEFFKYVDLRETRKLHGLETDVVEFIYNYWRLKRTANFNKPLIPTKIDEAALLGRHPEDSLYARMKRFVHLRQDLERVRNLCYMVSRREKLRRSFFKTKEEIFLKLVDALKSKKCSSKDFESFLKSSDGDTIYDQMYSRKNYRALDKPVISKDEEKAKSMQRPPNPYAKCYINGTRSRRHTSTNSLSDCSETSRHSEHEETNVKVPQENGRNKVVAIIEESKNGAKETEVATIEIEKPAKSFRSASKDSTEKSPDFQVCERQTRHTTHLSLKNEDIKPQIKDIIFEEIIIDKIPKSEPLDNIKNSPSQSDKENIVSKSRRGRKSKSQMDIKSVELSKAIENLSIKSEIETTDCLKVKDNIVTPKHDGSRYLMRSRNRSISESPTSPYQLPNNVPTKQTFSLSKQTFNHISAPDLLKEQKESMDIDDDPDIECLSDDKSDRKSASKVKFRKKRHSRQRLFRKTEDNNNNKIRSRSRRNLRSSESSDMDDIEEIDVDDKKEIRHITITPTSEFKMTLRQSKLVLSPRKLALRHSERYLNNELRHRSFSVSSESNENVINLDDDLQKSSADIKMESHPVNNRDLTSSPRLVLRLKKDPERQRWEKEPVPLDSLVFKVVRNDWENSLCHKTKRNSIDDREHLMKYEEINEPRYMMRKRSKPTTPS